MWDLPRPGLEPMSPALAGGLLTTAPPGKPQPRFLTVALGLSFSSISFFEPNCEGFVVLFLGLESYALSSSLCLLLTLNCLPRKRSYLKQSRAPLPCVLHWRRSEEADSAYLGQSAGARLWRGRGKGGASRVRQTWVTAV